MAKIDPRADPVSTPPESTEDFSVDRVAVPRSGKPVDKAIDPIVESASDEAPSPPLESKVIPVDKPAKVTSQDPRYEPIEKLLDANDWKAIAAELGPLDAIGRLPPNLGLVASLAHNENAKGGDADAAGIAIRCMAGLLGVADDSPIARVLARRILRKNPVTLRERQAPPARTSLLIVLVTLIVGGGVGWIASIGSWQGVARALHLM
jgi:hypothetical protein